MLALMLMVPLGLGVVQTKTFAEYRDLIDMPAIKIDSAPQSLLLDVTWAGKRLVAVGERGHILLSDDNGQIWAQTEVPTRAHLNAAYFVDEKTGWVVGEDAVILKTVDSGNTWTRQFDRRDAEMKGPLLELWFKDKAEGYAVGFFNKFYRTADGGVNWEAWQSHNPDNELDQWHLEAIAAVSDAHIYITSEQGLIFRSSDGGQSFKQIQTPHIGTFFGLLVREGLDGQDWIVLFGVAGALYVSKDSGGSWNPLDSKTDVGLSGGTWMPDGSAVIVGADGIILKLDQSLGSAQPLSHESGLPFNAVTTVDGNRLILVGYGGIQSFELPK